MHFLYSTRCWHNYLSQHFSLTADSHEIRQFNSKIHIKVPRPHHKGKHQTIHKSAFKRMRKARPTARYPWNKKNPSTSCKLGRYSRMERRNSEKYGEQWSRLAMLADRLSAQLTIHERDLRSSFWQVLLSSRRARECTREVSGGNASGESENEVAADERRRGRKR